MLTEQSLLLPTNMILIFSLYEIDKTGSFETFAFFLNFKLIDLPFIWIIQWKINPSICPVIISSFDNEIIEQGNEGNITE